MIMPIANNDTFYYSKQSKIENKIKLQDIVVFMLLIINNLGTDG